MRFRLTFLGLFITILTFTSVYAQDWRKSPLTSTTSNYWRTLPYTAKTSNAWRSSPLSAKQWEAKLRWNKNRWQNSSMNWRNRPDIKRTLDSSSWKNRWDKRITIPILSRAYGDFFFSNRAFTRSASNPRSIIICFSRDLK